MSLERVVHQLVFIDGHVRIRGHHSASRTKLDCMQTVETRFEIAEKWRAVI